MMRQKRKATLLCILLAGLGLPSPVKGDVVRTLPPFTSFIPPGSPALGPGMGLGVEGIVLSPGTDERVLGYSMGFRISQMAGSVGFELAGGMYGGWLTYVDYRGIRVWKEGLAFRQMFRLSWISFFPPGTHFEIGIGAGMDEQPYPKAYTRSLHVFPWYPSLEAFTGCGTLGRLWIRVAVGVPGLGVSQTIRIFQDWTVSGALLWPWPQPNRLGLSFSAGVWRDMDT